MKLVARVEAAYDKICKSIETSNNKLHMDTCCVMVGQFKMMFIDELIDEQLNKIISDHEHDLKMRMDEKAHKLGLLVI